LFGVFCYNGDTLNKEVTIMKPIYIVGIVLIAAFSLWIWTKIPFIALGILVVAALFFKGAHKLRGDDYDA